jgi:SRSO17 transposase
MTEQEIAGLSPAFASYLNRFRNCFAQQRSADHFATFCRGLLSDLPRKSVEPIALESGTAVRTLQEFLASSRWDHQLAGLTLRRYLAEALARTPADPLGTIGLIDETSCRKWGTHTPGVRRQYLGCVGKVDNGIVTVHFGVAKGDSHALLEADLYLPKSWDEDRDRCREAGIPDEVGYRAKWRIALDQFDRLAAEGWSFDWLTFDEGYGRCLPFLRALSGRRRKFVAEVPVNFTVRDAPAGPARRADDRLTADDARRGQRYRLEHGTTADSFWRARSARVWVGDGWHTLVVATDESTGEVKYFLTNAAGETPAAVLSVAFRRWRVEHAFRLAKSEAGLMHYEGRDYTGLMRHLSMAMVVLGFVAVQTERLRGEKPTGDGGASVPGVEPAGGRDLPQAQGRAGVEACR